MSIRTLRRRVALAAVGAMVVVSGQCIASPAQAAVSCQVTYTKAWDNGSGFGANITITNTGDPLTSWSLTWTWPGNQGGIQGWSANYAQSGPERHRDQPVLQRQPGHRRVDRHRLQRLLQRHEHQPDQLRDQRRLLRRRPRRR